MFDTAPQPARRARNPGLLSALIRVSVAHNTGFADTPVHPRDRGDLGQVCGVVESTQTAQCAACGRAVPRCALGFCTRRCAIGSGIRHSRLGNPLVCRGGRGGFSILNCL